jgi:hypothetical protein
MIMTTETSSSTSLDCLTFRGNSSFAGYTIQLHFCELGLKKLSQLLRKNPHASLHGTTRVSGVLDSHSSVLNHADWIRYEGDTISGFTLIPRTKTRLAAALQQYHRAWDECHVKPVPLTGYVALLDSTIHLIVECESGTTKTFKSMSAECLVFFN